MKKVLLVSLLLPTLMMSCNNGSRKKQIAGWALIGAGVVGTAASTAQLIEALHDTTDPNRMEKVQGWAAGLGSSILAGFTGVTTLLWKKAPTIAPLNDVTVSFTNPNVYATDSALNSSNNSTEMYPGVYDLSELFQEPDYQERTTEETTIE